MADSFILRSGAPKISTANEKWAIRSAFRGKEEDQVGFLRGELKNASKRRGSAIPEYEPLEIAISVLENGINLSRSFEGGDSIQKRRDAATYFNGRFSLEHAARLLESAARLLEKRDPGLAMNANEIAKATELRRDGFVKKYGLLFGDKKESLDPNAEPLSFL